MIRSCPNCANKLIFDINMGALSCDKCGGIFDVEEFDAQHAVEEEIRPADNEFGQFDEELAKEAHKRMMDINVFSCGACGADIIVSNTEASTFCIYCGNPNIVFSRIRKIARPEAIIPFTIPKELAAAILKERLKKGFLTPRALKKVTPESLVGIYVPYYINNLVYKDTISAEYYELESTGYNRRNTQRVRRSYMISGSCFFDRLTTDASTNLNDELSYRVEPFDVTQVVPFEEDYLLGFYSDIPDVDEDEAFKTASIRAKEVVHKSVLEMLEGSSKKILSSDPSIDRGSSPLLAMFPMWFLTYKYKGEMNTAIVNGQTGKVVCGVPIDKTKLTITALAIFIPLLLLALFLTPILILSGGIQLYIAIVVFGFGAFLGGLAMIRNVRMANIRSASSTVRRYALRRQGGQQ